MKATGIVRRIEARIIITQIERLHKYWSLLIFVQLNLFESEYIHNKSEGEAYLACLKS